jgi:hypothetical protein
LVRATHQALAKIVPVVDDHALFLALARTLPQLEGPHGPRTQAEHPAVIGEVEGMVVTVRSAQVRAGLRLRRGIR